MIKNLIFDWGGVLSRSDHKQAMQRLKEIGLENPEKYFEDGKNWYSIFGQIEEGEISQEEFLEKFSELCGRKVTFEDVAYGWWGFYAGMQEGVIDALKKWRGQYKVYMLTNNNPFMMSIIRSDGFAFEGKPFREYFDKIFASCDLGIAKPKKEIYEKVLSEENLEPEETIFIDDRLANLTGAEKAGMKTMLAEAESVWIEELGKRLNKNS